MSSIHNEGVRGMEAADEPIYLPQRSRFRDGRHTLTTFYTPSGLLLHLPTETGAALSEMEFLLVGDVQVNDRHDSFKQRL